MTSKDAATSARGDRWAFVLTVLAVLFQTAMSILGVTVLHDVWWSFVLVVGSAAIAGTAIVAFHRRIA